MDVLAFVPEKFEASVCLLRIPILLFDFFLGPIRLFFWFVFENDV